MAVSRNWSAQSVNGVAGYEIIVRGEANVGLLTVVPELVKRDPQGLNPSILLLDLENAGDAMPENFHEVQYNEKIDASDQYKTVEIFHSNESVEAIEVELTQ